MERKELEVEITLLLDLGDDPYPGDEMAKEAIRRHLEGSTFFWASGLATPASVATTVARAGHCAVVDEATIGRIIDHGPV